MRPVLLRQPIVAALANAVITTVRLASRHGSSPAAWSLASTNDLPLPADRLLTTADENSNRSLADKNAIREPRCRRLVRTRPADWRGEALSHFSSMTGRAKLALRWTTRSQFGG
jgi:hypothetical protein